MRNTRTYLGFSSFVASPTPLDSPLDFSIELSVVNK